MGLFGIEDKDIFLALGERDIALLITADLAQVNNPREREGLADANLHWLGIPPILATGIGLIAQVLSIVIPGVGHALEEWPEAPTAFFLSDPPKSVISASFPL